MSGERLVAGRRFYPVERSYYTYHGDHRFSVVEGPCGIDVWDEQGKLIGTYQAMRSVVTAIDREVASWQLANTATGRDTADEGATDVAGD